MCIVYIEAYILDYTIMETLHGQIHVIYRTYHLFYNDRLFVYFFMHYRRNNFISNTTVNT